MNGSKKTNLEKMNKRRELVEDKRRYIIFYTFGDEPEEKGSENSVQTQSNEEKNV